MTKAIDRHLRNGTALRLVAAASLTLAAGAAHGQVEEVTITATRFETNLQTTSASVTALSPGDLQASNVSALQDLPSVTPSLIVNKTSGQDMPIALRGISSAAQGIGGDSPVAIYVDGVYIGRPLATTFQFADISRIEVLRGPQGTLYGRNATGGAINIFTADPTEEFALSGMARIGNYENLEMSASVSGPITEQLAFKLGAGARGREGFEENVTRHQKVNGIESSTFDAGLRWTVDDSAYIDLRGDYSDQELQPFARLLAPNFVSAVNGRNYSLNGCPIDCDVIFSNEPAHIRADGGGGSLTGVWDAGAVSLKSITAYRTLNQSLLIDNDLTEVQTSRIRYIARTHQFTQEVNVSSNSDGPLNWIVGAFYYYEISRSRFASQNFGNAFGMASPFTNFLVSTYPDVDTEAFAAFLDGNYDLTDRLTLGAGVRYSYEEKSFLSRGAAGVQPFTGVSSADVPYLPPAATFFDLSDSWDDVSPRVSLSYEFSDDLFGYVQAQRGFKSGGYAFSASGAVNPGFGPETIWSYEAGVKSNFLDNTVQVNLAAFYYDYEGLQQALSITPASRSIFNAADATVKGAELEFTWIPAFAPDLRLSGQVSYIDASFDDFNINLTGFGAFLAAGQCLPGGVLTIGPQITCSFSGNTLPRAPKWRWALFAEYAFDLGSMGTLIPHVDVLYQSNTFYTPQNDPSASSQGDFTDVNAKLTWTPESGNYSFSIWGRNLTDERHIEQSMVANIAPSAVPGAPFPFGAVGASGVPNDPLTFGLEATYRY